MTAVIRLISPSSIKGFNMTCCPFLKNAVIDLKSTHSLPHHLANHPLNDVDRIVGENVNSRQTILCGWRVFPVFIIDMELK
jgi:hypothetical protein